MSALANLIADGRRAGNSRPWPRTVVDGDGWRAAANRLAEGAMSLLGLWGDDDSVHMALLESETAEIGVLTFECRDRRFPSVGAVHPPALRLERTVRDLFGLEPAGIPDARPWLDHGRWGVHHPMGLSHASPAGGGPYKFLPVEGEGLHQIPVGPVHAGIIEPGHFRFTANGETVVRLEARLGYVHKGIERLLQGADLDRAAKLAGRISGDCTVAYALAFARAVEAALEIAPPYRAVWLRGLAAELERLANHFGDIGAICNDAAFALMHAHCGVLRERVLRACERAFGHRLMRDCIIPGGVAAELYGNSQAELLGLVDELRRGFSPLVELYDNTASLQDRTVGTGVLKRDLAQQYACGGFIGRAAGRSFDARRTPGYPPYDRLTFDVPSLTEGDVNARVWIRIREVEQSLTLVQQILERLPAGPIRVALDSAGEPREGCALVEGFRGEILVWLRLGGDGTVARCHLRDPSWFQWPLLEAVIEGNIVADFPLCNKSFNCSYSGHDL
jgi:Ni,Fe-hydrogenase III large subunit